MIPKEIVLLDINLSDLEVLQKLPLHHKDPFDRITISQAISKNLILMSEDGNFPYYKIELI